jgi:hypothetical protein
MANGLTGPILVLRPMADGAASVALSPAAGARLLRKPTRERASRSVPEEWHEHKQARNRGDAAKLEHTAQPKLESSDAQSTFHSSFRRERL